MFKKLVVVDGKGHLAGRLASYIAKEALNGQRVVVVRCEKLLVSGNAYRNKIKVMDFKHKRMSTNHLFCIKSHSIIKTSKRSQLF